MHVGIYNRYLPTLGGGEKLSLAIAEYLSSRHSVSVISHSHVPKMTAAKRFNLDLSQVEFLNIPTQPPKKITPITAKYDVFINVTDMMYFPSLAQNSVMLVYFPALIYPKWSNSLRWRLKMAARRWFQLPTFIGGPVDMQFNDASIIWSTDTEFNIQLPISNCDYRFNFELYAQDRSVQQASLFLNGIELMTIELPPDQQFTSCEIVVPRTVNSNCNELTIRGCGDAKLNGENAINMMGIAKLKLALPRYRLYQILIERLFKSWGKRLHEDLPKTWILDSLDTYDAIWAISKFTQDWIGEYWDRKSQVLYSPVYVEDFRIGHKYNQILSVGRFFTGRHNKKHLVMIEIFKELVDQGLTGWELHLAGGSMLGDKHQEYLQQVYRQTAGYPIIIHLDISFDELVKLYSESKIYWHATGFGEDEAVDPVKSEHFGITTIEAMASGCVPVVIGKGGQPEIVQEGKCGFLWQTTGELKSITMQLIKDPVLIHKMSAAAVEESRRYNKSHFQSRLQELLQQLGL